MKKSTKKCKHNQSFKKQLKIVREILDTSFIYYNQVQIFVSDLCMLVYAVESNSWGLCPKWTKNICPWILQECTHIQHMLLDSGIQTYFTSGTIVYDGIGEIYLEDIWVHAKYKKENFNTSLAFMEKKLFTEAILDGAL
jgi:hypothetical protein